MGAGRAGIRRMGTTLAENLKQFHWEPQPRAAAMVREVVEGFLGACPAAAALAQRMRHDTATRFIDWVDHIQVPRSEKMRQRLIDAGFSRQPAPGAPDCYANDAGIFPRVIFGSGAETRVAIKVDSVIDFLSAWHLADDPTSSGDDVEGDPWSQYRRARAFRSGDAELWVVERHGYRGFVPGDPSPVRTVQTLKHLEAFRRRAREWAEDAAGFDHTEHLVDAAVADLGRDLACDLFFHAEREYWQRRNRAAQIQKARQDRLGLGWANHDHHTYRSSREHFTRLIGVFERLGFGCRERFYAGHEAGWGAQVLEQAVAGITIFADVDLSPEEVDHDFAHEPLPFRAELGTVGLWCALHGEAILQAGMHHLECMFDHDALVDQLEAASVRTMDPFTNFAYLKQAFTEGERWPVSPARIERLVQAGRITAQQAHAFRMQGGAIGSHLENLERNDGFKGFNQKGVSEIIARTDPRRQVHDLIGA